VTDRGLGKQAVSTLSRLGTVLAIFQDIYPAMPLSEVQAFISVAKNEGKSLGELAHLTGTKQSSISRYLLDLSDKMRDGSAGYGIVRREIDPKELRRNIYSLSPSGLAIVHRIADIIG
jgi:DNA-binding MarR family transcriptional regulator